MTPPDDLSEEDRTTKDRLDILTQAVQRLRGRQWRIVPHPGPIGGEQHVSGGKSGALRAAIFGVSGAGVDNSFVIVAGVAGLLAGAFSMAAGEYISVRVQREVYERLIHLEAHEIGSDPEAERQELAELYVRKGLPRDLSDRLATELMKDPEVALETHAREELGLDPREGLGSPFAAAGSSFVTFSLGAFVPLLPFLVSSGTSAVVASAILSGIALFGVGAAMSYLTGRPWLLSGSRMLAVGAAAAGVTYLVGRALDVGVLS